MFTVALEGADCIEAFLVLTTCADIEALVDIFTFIIIDIVARNAVTSVTIGLI